MAQRAAGRVGHSGRFPHDRGRRPGDQHRRVSHGDRPGRVVVATGGLGPTADDLTRDAIAAAVGVELVQDDAALAHIRKLFARRGRAMPERNKLQAQFPRGSRVVPNPHGTAPGIDLDRAARVLPALPRVRAARRAGRDVRDVERNRGAGDSRRPSRRGA